MLAIDTNVLVRLLVADDARQAAQALRVIEAEYAHGRPVLVSLLVLLETEWVLRSRYELPKERVVLAFAALLETAAIRIEDEDCVARALFLWQQESVGFADCLIAGRHLGLGATATLTFDRRAARRAGMQLLPPD